MNLKRFRMQVLSANPDENGQLNINLNNASAKETPNGSKLNLELHNAFDSMADRIDAVKDQVQKQFTDEQKEEIA